MSKAYILPILVAVGLTACETPPYALFPIYTDENVFTDSTIFGRWDFDGESILVVERAGEFGFKYTWSAGDEGAITGTGYTLNLGTRTF